MSTSKANHEGDISSRAIAASSTGDTAGGDNASSDTTNGSESEPSNGLRTPDHADRAQVAHLLPAAASACRALLRDGQALTQRLRANGPRSPTLVRRLPKILKGLVDDVDHENLGGALSPHSSLLNTWVRPRCRSVQPLQRRALQSSGEWRARGLSHKQRVNEPT